MAETNEDRDIRLLEITLRRALKHVQAAKDKPLERIINKRLKQGVFFDEDAIALAKGGANG